MEMTPKELKRICRELQLYSTAELNDKLYLHYKGFKKIENLEPFTGLKVIYLEGNGFRKIEGLDALKQLRCLYLQENQIEVMENLDALTELDSLNLNQNVVKRIGGLSQLRRLNTLLLQGNKLSSLETLEGLAECPSLGVLDLSKNDISDPGVVGLLARALPQLKVLYLKDNPVVSEIANYRKTVIAALPQLTYLDERPVFDEERRTVDAWARGGKAEEQVERQRIEREKNEKEVRNYQAFEKMLADARSEQGAPAVGAVQGGRIVEENEGEGADADDDEIDGKQRTFITSSESSALPALEDADEQDAIIAHAVRATSQLHVTHSAAEPATAASSSSSRGPVQSLVTPASAASGAIAGGKKVLIEMVDDDEKDEKQEAEQKQPAHALIQQLD